jgi:hypothetical protein
MFGSILSKDKNDKLYCNEINNFQLKLLDNKEKNFNNILFTKDLGGQYLNYEELFCNSNIVINSHLQRLEFYYKHKDFLNDIIKFNNSNKKINDEDIIINIRLSDYCNYNVNYEYQDIIWFFENYSKEFNNFYIITEEPNHEIIKNLLKINKFKIIHGNEIEHFSYFFNSKNILLSHSTFSWTPAFLGKSQNIYSLYTDKDKMWRYNPSINNDDIDLCDENLDSRFKKILIK